VLKWQEALYQISTGLSNGVFRGSGCQKCRNEKGVLPFGSKPFKWSRRGKKNSISAFLKALLYKGLTENGFSCWSLIFAKI
jgi:hypothetical protein